MRTKEVNKDAKIRHVDDLGRIVIPKEYRIEMNNGNPDMEDVACEISIVTDAKGRIGVGVFICEEEIEC